MWTIRVTSTSYVNTKTLRCAETFLKQKISIPSPDRLWYVADGFRKGLTVEEIFDYSKIDPWFLVQIKDLIDDEIEIQRIELSDLSYEDNQHYHARDPQPTSSRSFESFNVYLHICVCVCVCVPAYVTHIVFNVSLKRSGGMAGKNREIVCLPWAPHAPQGPPGLRKRGRWD